VTNAVNGDEIGVTVSGAQTNAGYGYTATASALTGGKAGNYKLPTANTQSFNIAKAAAQSIADVTLSQVYTLTEVSASVAGKMPDDAGTLSYTQGAATATGSVTVSNITINDDGSVTATLSGGAAGDTVTLPVTISSTNYEDSTVDVVVTLTVKNNAGVSITQGSETVGTITKTYGDEAFTLTGNVTTEGENGGWTWTSSDTAVATVTNGSTATPTITILKASTASVTITAKYESDTTIGEATITLTVNKAAQSTPDANSLHVTNETLEGKNDGSISGLNDNMEISSDAGSNYTAVTSMPNYNSNSGTLSGLAARSYLVRLAENENHAACGALTLTVEGGPKAKVEWYNDGELLDTTYWAYNQNPTYAGNTPTKSPTEDCE
jgi:hypothetical protein